MSHFTCLVIGKNPENQLAPFDESLDTPEYSKGEVTTKDKERFLNFYQTYDPKRSYSILTEAEAEVNKTLTFEELYEIYGEDWNYNGWMINPETGKYEEYSTYNPNSHWDWYQLGGRWAGFFKLKPVRRLGFELEGFSTPEVANLVEMCKNDPEKFIKVTSKYNGKTETIRKAIHNMITSMDEQSFPENKVGDKSWTNESEVIPTGRADQALKRHIDFEGMRDEAGKTAREDYEKIKAIFGGVIPVVEHKWASIIDKENPKFSEMSIDEKKDFYHAQPGVLELKKYEKEIGFSFDIDTYQCTVDEYVDRARKEACSTFAVIKDGKWYEKGHMGWWASVSNEKDDWLDEFNKLLDSTPEDEILSVYDCHI